MKKRENEDKETGKRRRQGGGERGASGLGRELERWIFFMKGFEQGRAPRLVLKPRKSLKSES